MALSDRRSIINSKHRLIGFVNNKLFHLNKADEINLYPERIKIP